MSYDSQTETESFEIDEDVSASQISFDYPAETETGYVEHIIISSTGVVFNGDGEAGFSASILHEGAAVEDGSELPVNSPEFGSETLTGPVAVTVGGYVYPGLSDVDISLEATGEASPLDDQTFDITATLIVRTV